MKYVMLGWLILYLGISVNAQEKFTISGYALDKTSGEGLIAANVIDLKTGKGTVTNTYGFYSLTLPKDSVILAISYIGFETQILPMDLNQDKNIDISLSLANAIKAVEIVAERAEKIEEKTQMSTIKVPVSQLKKLPALLGETDILKTLQLLPGVQSGGEGQSGFYVRGGSPDQNLILLDGVPVYNASHLFGFFSVFNADAIKDVTLVKGGFPARYGGRLSSVLDISMKEGNMKSYHGSGTLGLVASKFTFEGPLLKDKAAFIVSGRRTYIDQLARPFIARSLKSQNSSGSLGYYFYDLNAKINWKISSKDRIFLSAYSGDDQFRSDITTNNEFGSTHEGKERINLGLGWGNLTSSLRWNHLWTDKLFSNTSLTYSNYSLNSSNGFEYTLLTNSVKNEELKAGFGYDSGIEDVTGKIQFDYIPSPNQFVRFGATLTRHKFTPGIQETKFDLIENGIQVLSIDSMYGQENVEAYESAVYLEDDIEITSRLKANIGLHYSAFYVKDKAFQSLQPRIAARYLFDNSLSAKASFATMQQNIQFLSNENIGLPWDQWLPTTDKVIPQTSWQAAVGLAKTFDGKFEISIEAYYKEMKNVSAYVEGASIFQNKPWQEQVTQGDGRSYGGELFIQKKTGKFTGWIGYTLSWSDRRFDDKNFGERYPYKFDRRHDISLVGIYELNDHWNFSATWVYGTGNAFTFPVSQSFRIIDDGPSSFLNPINNITKRNNFRLAPFHRLDVNVDYMWGKKAWEHKISLGAYNAYNRRNPFFVNPTTVSSIDPNTGEPSQRTVLKQYSLFRLIPSISYSFKF